MAIRTTLLICTCVSLAILPTISLAQTAEHPHGAVNWGSLQHQPSADDPYAQKREQIQSGVERRMQWKMLADKSMSGVIISQGTSGDSSNITGYIAPRAQ